MDQPSFSRNKVGIFSLNILSWLLFLALVFPAPAPCGIKEELQLRITVMVNWNIETGGGSSGAEVNKGYLEYKIRGKLKLNKEFSPTQRGLPAVYVPYRLHQATVSYQYQEQIFDKNPPKYCPALVSVHTGGGSVSMPPLPGEPGNLIINYIDSILKSFKAPRVAGTMPEALIDTYMFGSPGIKQTVIGKKLERKGKACVYKPSKKEIGLPIFRVRFKIPQDGKMSGTRSWSSRADMSPHFDIRLSDLPPSMEKKSYVPEKDPNGNVHYDVSWTFDEQLPPETEIQSVSFNYPGENKNKQIVLNLFELESNRKISAPEWIKGDVNEPAAFVLDHPFKVKAVFQADPEVKRAEIWAEEDVLGGDGGFGGIKKKTIDFNGEKGEGEFEIERPQKAIGVNKVKWIWKGRDKTKSKEEALMNLGESEHKIYVVGGGPGGKVLPMDFNSYDYVVRKGCEWAAGTTGGRATFDRIWANFINIPTPNSPTLLTYKHDKENYTTRALLMSGQGKCAAWSEFFYDTMASQGIQVEKVTVKPKTPFNWLIVHNQPGQNNPTPHRVFQNHALAVYQNHFYDPSYHTSTPRVLLEYEFRTFVAYCVWESIQAEANMEHLISSLLPKLLQPCYKVFEQGTNESFTDCLTEKSLGCAKNDPLQCEVE